MGKVGGVYLSPMSFFSEDYTKDDFMEEGFWNKEMGNWGNIIHNFDHVSTSFVKRNGSKVNPSR